MSLMEFFALASAMSAAIFVFIWFLVKKGV